MIKNHSSNKEYYKHVISSSNILPKIHEIFSKVRTPAIGNRQLNKLVQRLLDSHRPLRLNVLDEFQISYNDLIKGVLCPHCPQTVMKVRHGKWTCPGCRYTSYDGFIAAFNDYFLLVSDEITNRKRRDFLQITSKDKMNRLLKKAGFRSIGETSGRKYILEYKEREDRITKAVR